VGVVQIHRFRRSTFFAGMSGKFHAVHHDRKCSEAGVTPRASGMMSAKFVVPVSSFHGGRWMASFSHGSDIRGYASMLNLRSALREEKRNVRSPIFWE